MNNFFSFAQPCIYVWHLANNWYAKLIGLTSWFLTLFAFKRRKYQTNKILSHYWFHWKCPQSIKPSGKIQLQVTHWKPIITENISCTWHLETGSNLSTISNIKCDVQGDQRELRKSMTLLLRLRGSVGTKTYGKISLRSGHFDIWLLKYPKKLFSSKLRYVKKLSDFHI